VASLPVAPQGGGYPPQEPYSRSGPPKNVTKNGKAYTITGTVSYSKYADDPDKDEQLEIDATCS
jgi:hypothetical protein